DVLAVVHLVCHDREAMMARLRARALKENRPDDTDEKVIRNRFEVYERQTRPILDYYPRDKIIEVDCVGVPARVASRILAALAPLQERLAGGCRAGLSGAPRCGPARRGRGAAGPRP